PLGQMILALPMVVTGNVPSKPIELNHWPPGISAPGERTPGEPPPSPLRAKYERTIRKGVLYGNRWSPPALLTLIALWKSALFVPVIAVIFQWCRAIYGSAAAWLTTTMILVDPTFAAHIPII